MTAGMLAGGAAGIYGNWGRIAPVLFGEGAAVDAAAAGGIGIGRAPDWRGNDSWRAFRHIDGI